MQDYSGVFCDVKVSGQSTIYLQHSKTSLRTVGTHQVVPLFKQRKRSEGKKEGRQETK